MINKNQFKKTTTTYAKYIDGVLFEKYLMSVITSQNEKVLLSLFEMLEIKLSKLDHIDKKLFIINDEFKTVITSGWLKNYGALNYNDQVKNFKTKSREAYSNLCEKWEGQNIISIGYDFNFDKEGKIDLENSFIAVIDSKPKFDSTDFESGDFKINKQNIKHKNTKTIRVNYESIKEMIKKEKTTDFMVNLKYRKPILGKLIPLKNLETASNDLISYLKTFINDEQIKSESSIDILENDNETFKVSYPLKISEEQREKQIQANDDKVLMIKNRDGEFVSRSKENFFNETDGSCQECGYSFKKETGFNYIEMHHKQEFANSDDLVKEYNSLEEIKNDFDFLCSNCHTKKHLK